MIKETQRFCCWRYEQRDGRKTKVPYDPVTGKRAETNKPETFSDFKTALSVLKKYDGIGIRIGNDICALDLDDCFEENGKLKPWAQDIVDMFSGCYMELSPSGKGLRIIFIASNYQYDKAKYYINNRALGLEVYVAGATNRFVTLTGNVYREGDIPEKTEVLKIMLDKYMLRPATTRMETPAFEGSSYLSDESVIVKASSAANREKFKALWQGDFSGYASQSEADLALCCILAFCCGKDARQMDRLFRQSGLFRDKWDRPQSGSTYGQITLEKAIAVTTTVYSPIGKMTDVVDDFEADDTPDLKELRPHDNPRYGWSDIGNSNLFADYYKSITRYVPERKQWFVYDGKAWRSDIGNLKVMNLCKKLANNLMVFALSISDERLRKVYIDYVRKWQLRRSRETILKDAQDVHPISMSSFDTNIYLLNCLNGTLDLQNGGFYPHRASDFITKVAGIRYDPLARCPRWERFIDEVMSGDKEKAEFLQKSLGYSLTGDTRYETMFILYGATTRNGKGTSMETFLRICGDYGKTCRPETIGMKPYNSSSSPSEDVARLAGARFVNISEPDKKLTLSAALLKTLTGSDTVNARFLHENSFDFKPQFKIFANTNHLPTVTDLTLLSSGRVKIIPFERHFAEHERDLGLKDEFSKSENLSGILNWVLEGYAKLRETGFEIPQSVKDATLSYHRENDKVGLFIEERLIEDENCEERTADIYYAYQGWCKENGYYSENVKNFKTALANTVRIERKRPRTGGEKTTVVIGRKLLRGVEFLA